MTNPDGQYSEPDLNPPDGAVVIACALASDDLGSQVDRWRRLGRDAGLERIETENGLRVRFRDEPAVEQELRALVAVESTCCSWARWEILRADGDLVLVVTSTTEGAGALHAMLTGDAA